MASPVHLEALQPFPVDQMPPALAGGVVAVGNFDGVHRGHRALLDTAKDEAARRGVPALVLTFDPHPRTVLRPAHPPVFRLTPLPAKARLLKALALDGLAVARFDLGFAAMTADEFVDTVLIGQLKISAAVVGFNFRFGRNRAGTVQSLAALGQRLDFAVCVVDPVAERSGSLVASSDIRTALAAGDVTGANALLGYRWFVVGTVERGAGRGRDLGFPTANLRLPDDCALRHGIYAVRLQRAGGAVHDGVASFGVRPTFGGGAPLLEIFVFDFSGDLYGQEVAVAFHSWIRPEATFSGAAELVAAMQQDTLAAQGTLAAAGPGSDLDRRLAALA
jgi:riboflavin kinase / FMN adenylyltransferase